MNKILVNVFLFLFIIAFSQANAADDMNKTQDSIKHSKSGWFISSGMSKIELLKKVGAPDTKKTTQDSSGNTREEWIYKDGSDYITVIIFGGTVSSVRKD